MSKRSASPAPIEGEAPCKKQKTKTVDEVVEHLAHAFAEDIRREFMKNLAVAWNDWNNATEMGDNIVGRLTNPFDYPVSPEDDLDYHSLDREARARVWSGVGCEMRDLGWSIEKQTGKVTSNRGDPLSWVKFEITLAPRIA